MGEESQGKYKLVNAYEDQVTTVVRDLIKSDPDMCQCEKCFLDVCAIVYNGGFSRFVTTERGSLLAMLPDLSDNRDVELLVLAMNAIKMVKSRPSH